MQEFTDPTLSRLLQGIKSFQQRFYEKEPNQMRDLVGETQCRFDSDLRHQKIQGVAIQRR